MKIALVSLNQEWEDKETNKKKCTDAVIAASGLDCDIVIFPEMTLTGFSMQSNIIGESIENPHTIDFFRTLASRYKCAIFFGVVLLENGSATNNLVTINDKGEIMSLYPKIHPFSYSGENLHYSQGNRTVLSRFKNAVIGSSICYDLRFPEIFQSMAETCNVIVTIANWPMNRIKHWEVLLQARAIENQVFMAGINRTGTDGNNIRYVRSSYIFSPFGEKIEPVESQGELDVYEIDPEEVEKIRTSFPFRKDRRKDLYRLFYSD